MWKILILRTCKTGFEKIINWDMCETIRPISDYWKSRLIDKNWNFKEFDKICIKNWYRKDSPYIVYQLNWISIENNEFVFDFWEVEEISWNSE